MKKRITVGQRFMSNILKVSYINNISNESLAKMLDISTRTLSARKEHPETLTAEEIDRFCECTNTDIADIVK